MSKQKWWKRRPLPQPVRLFIWPAALAAAAATRFGLEACNALGILVLNPEPEPETTDSDSLSTVGELRKALRGVPDDLDVLVRAWDDDNDYIGEISGAAVHEEHGGEGKLYFAIDCGPADSDELPPEAEEHVGREIELDSPGAVMIAHISPEASQETVDALRGIGNAVIKQMSADDDAELVRRMTAAMREADAAFERLGGSTRHHVRECLLPVLEKHGLKLSLV